MPPTAFPLSAQIAVLVLARPADHRLGAPAENARRRAIRQLERLGHKVTLQPLAEAA